MATPFIHTTRALGADGTHRQAVIAIIGLLFLTAWGLWFFLAEITIYKTSSNARLQQYHNTVQLSAPHTGRVVAVNTALGEEVSSGDSLLSFDTHSLDLAVSGETELLHSLDTQLEAVERERQLVETKFLQDKQSQQQQLTLLRDKYQLQKSNLDIQADITARYERLLAKQQSSQLDYLKAKRSLQKMAMETLQAESAIKAAEDQLKRLGSDYQQSLAELDQRRGGIEQQLVQADTRKQQRILAKDEFQLRAPIAGRIASLADINAGQLLEAGDIIGSIQAAGAIRVQAQFEPSAALGHIKAGQWARVRLDGFSWAHYGEIAARVEQVATAVQGAQILVQLTIEGDIPPSLPVMHDLPATVEVATAHKTPFQLLLQRTGDWLDGAARQHDHKAESAP